MTQIKGLLPETSVDLAMMRGENLRAQLNKSAALREGKTAAAREKEIHDAAQQFEGMLVQEMLKSMWKTVPKDTLLGDGREMELFNEMFQEAIAKRISEGQGIGVKEVIIRDIKAREAQESKGK